MGENQEACCQIQVRQSNEAEKPTTPVFLQRNIRKFLDVHERRLDIHRFLRLVEKVLGTDCSRCSRNSRVTKRSARPRHRIVWTGQRGWPSRDLKEGIAKLMEEKSTSEDSPPSPLEVVNSQLKFGPPVARVPEVMGSNGASLPKVVSPKLALKGLGCPICNQGITSVEEGFLHLRSRHVGKASPTAIYTLSIIGSRWQKMKREDFHPPKLEEIHWVAPNHTFTQLAKEHLAWAYGFDVRARSLWHKVRRKNPAIADITKIANQSDAASKPATAVDSVAAEPSVPDQAPVAPLVRTTTRPNRVRKKFQVPAAPPGRTYFRTVSKRPITEGEWLSESDDDVDEDWLRQMLEQELETLPGLSDAEVTFLKNWNGFMIHEPVHGKKVFQNALVRFAEDNVGLWTDESIADVFRKKVVMMHARGEIDEPTEWACHEIVDQVRKTPPPAPAPSVPGPSLQDVKAMLKGGNVPIIDALGEEKWTGCICGQAILSSSSVIFCGNLVSPRSNHSFCSKQRDPLMLPSELSTFGLPSWLHGSEKARSRQMAMSHLRTCSSSVTSWSAANPHRGHFFQGTTIEQQNLYRESYAPALVCCRLL